MKCAQSILTSVAVIGIACSVSAVRVHAAVVDVGQGLYFSQFDLTFSGATQLDSAYGLAAVDFNQLTTTTGISTGYLNVITSAGWVVQNMLVDSGSGYPGSSTMFNLGNTPSTDVTSLTAYADFSSAPTTSFSAMPSIDFAVGNLAYNAQGRGTGISSPAPPPSTPVINWVLGGVTSWVQQLFRTSVEQDTNQCGPGAVANSLQYLEDEYGIDVPHDHVPGIDGKDNNGDPDKSLVGEIDESMGRAPHATVTDEQFMRGKLDYITGNSLADGLVLKHWGGTFVPGNRQSTDGRVTSRDVSGSGIGLIDWIIQEIENGEDVELAIPGHWINVTDAGRTFGIPWISWTHDANQGFDDNGTPGDTSDDTTLLNGGTNWWDGGVGWSPLVDDKLVFFLEGSTLDFAVSQSIPEASSFVVWTLLGCLGITVGWWRRRRRAG